MSFKISPQATNNSSDRGLVQKRVYLPVSFTTNTSDAWVDSGLSITVPKGVYKVRYNLTGSASNDAAGVLQMNARLFNVTSNAPVDDSQRFLATGCYVVGVTAPYSGSAEFDALVYLDVPATFRVEILKESVGGAPNLALIMSLDAGCFLEYEEA